MKRDEISRLLPSILRETIHEGNPLDAILDVMSQLPRSSEEVLETLNTFFHPFLTPGRFVPYIASWVDLERLFDEPFRDPHRQAFPSTSPLPTGADPLRALTAAAAYLSKWRGTEKGLLLFLEIATATKGFTIDQPVIRADGRPVPFHIRVVAPDSVRVQRRLIERIVESEKPAYVTWELEFQPPPKEVE
jgi:phage tail-like protein